MADNNIGSVPILTKSERAKLKAEVVEAAFLALPEHVQEEIDLMALALTREIDLVRGGREKFGVLSAREVIGKLALYMVERDLFGGGHVQQR